LTLSMVRALFGGRRSVRDDWIAWLPPDKLALFRSVTTRWERALTMSGVALHDSFELRAKARFEQASLHVQMTSEIVARNAAELIRAVNIVYNESRHIGDLPQVEPLNPSNFRSGAARRVAQWNTLFHWVLFDARSQYFQKLRLLEIVIRDASSEFAASADDLTETFLSGPQESWDALADLECDLNTSERELEIVLKAFLRSLPSSLIAAIGEALETPMSPAPRRSRSRASRVSN
jgi:hypothetical protein